MQRILNPRRISQLKEFALAGGQYPNNIILNWVNKSKPLKAEDGKITIPSVERSAQIIDGQHRIAGLREAIRDQPTLGDLQIPVSLYEYLDTRACADIFISINTEQRPVQRSLVFDLYGVSSEYLVDPAAVRARDIAQTLNEEESSPYHDLIRFPGTSTGKRGGVALSTAATALKPLVESKGNFELVGVVELAMQTKVIFNYFNALRNKYQDKWLDSSNAFLYASGFLGAAEFLKLHMIPFCNNKGNFTQDLMERSLNLNSTELIRQDEVKGLSGTKAQLKVLERLKEAFEPGTKNSKIQV